MEPAVVSSTVDAPCPLILNAKAGALKSTASVDQLLQLGESVGVKLDVITSSSPLEMQSIIRRLVNQGAERVGVAGGDGTVGQAIQELVHTNTAIGIIPQGTFNNFATALRLPSDLPSSLRILKDGEPYEVSVGKVGDKFFTEAAGIGLFADALAIYGRGSNKNPFRAFYAIFKVFLGMRARRMRLTLDGEVVQERAVWCTVANTYRMAQGLAIAPEAKLTDDQLDVVVVGDIGRFEFMRYYRMIRAQLHTTLPKVSVYRASRIRVDTRGSAIVHADDAVIARTPVDIEVQPQALKVLVDRI